MNTKIKKIEKKYGKDYGCKSDKNLSNFLKGRGYNSLNKLLRNDKE